MIEISKELLSEVLGKKIKEFVIEKNELRYILQDDTSSIPDLHFINIYELVHKCKEWAYNDFGLNIFIEKHTFNLYESSIKICRFNNRLGSYNSFCSYYPKEKTEFEAVIKACEWVLKEIKK